MSFLVRGLTPGDHAQWSSLWAGYLAFYETELEPGVTKTTWARLNDPGEPIFGLGAEDESDGELVGLVHCVLHRGTWAIGDLCYLEDLFVSPKARGKGAGRALIEAVYARADALGCSRVYWLTHETNQTARRLYDQVGRNYGFIQYRRPPPEG